MGKWFRTCVDAAYYQVEIATTCVDAARPWLRHVQHLIWNCTTHPWRGLSKNSLGWSSPHAKILQK